MLTVKITLILPWTSLAQFHFWRLFTFGVNRFLFFLPLLNNSLIFHRAGSFKKFLAPFRAKMVSFWASKFHFCLILCFFPVRQTLICDDEEELDETPQSISISPFFCGPLTPNLFLRLFYTSNKTLNRITQILWLPN